MTRIAWLASLVLVAAGCSASHSHPSAEGVGGVAPNSFTQRGIYIGPPGTVPAGIPNTPLPTPATTSGTGGSVSAGTELSAIQLAVRGDPANGRATVSAQEAVATAKRNVVGPQGPFTIGAPKLVQVDFIYVPMVATAWAIPVTGTFELSDGPPTRGKTSVTRSALRTTTAIIFVDGVTGRFIAQEGFG
jgi:hypothetical protein